MEPPAPSPTLSPSPPPWWPPPTSPPQSSPPQSRYQKPLSLSASMALLPYICTPIPLSTPGQRAFPNEDPPEVLPGWEPRGFWVWFSGLSVRALRRVLGLLPQGWPSVNEQPSPGLEEGLLSVGRGLLRWTPAPQMTGLREGWEWKVAARVGCPNTQGERYLCGKCTWKIALSESLLGESVCWTGLARTNVFRSLIFL